MLFNFLHPKFEINDVENGVEGTGNRAILSLYNDTKRQDKFILQYISTVNGFCQRSNNLQYLIKCLVKFPVFVVVHVATSLVNKR